MATLTDIDGTSTSLSDMSWDWFWCSTEWWCVEQIWCGPVLVDDQDGVSNTLTDDDGVSTTSTDQTGVSNTLTDIEG